MTHRPKPVYSGGTVDAYLAAVEAWKKEHTTGGGTGGQPLIRNNPITGALEVWSEELQMWIPSEPIDPNGGTGTGTTGSAGRSLAEDLQYLEAKYGWDSKLELEVLEREYKLKGGMEEKLIKLSAAEKLKFLREEIQLTKDMKLELMVKQHGLDLIMQDDQQAFETLTQATQNEWQGSQNQLDRDLAREEGEAGREHETEENRLDREAREKEQEDARNLARFTSVQELRGKDPVRAALMAMGAGDAGDAFGSYSELGSLVNEAGEDIGATLQGQTEEALRGIEGLGGQGLSIGDTGVEGLRNVEKAGRSYVEGSQAVQTLIGSAQGIGSSTQAGVSTPEVEARIKAITPKGFDFKPAAEGAGLTPTNAPRALQLPGTEPIQPNTVYEAGEAGPEALVVGPDKKLEKIIPLGNRARVTQEGVAAGVTEPYLGGADVAKPNDALVSMFNDPDLTLKRGDRGDDIYTGGGIRAGGPGRNEGEMLGLKTKLAMIQKKRAMGIPLTPEEEAFISRFDIDRLPPITQQEPYNPYGVTKGGVPWNPDTNQPVPQPGRAEVLPPVGLPPREFNDPRRYNNELTPVGSGMQLQEQRQAQIDNQQRRQEYIASLPPAQQAALRQASQKRAAAQQDQLTNALTPETIKSLMTLINNPQREVDSNLKEVLPQLRDGAGNITPTPQRLAQVV